MIPVTNRVETIWENSDEYFNKSFFEKNRNQSDPQATIEIKFQSTRFYTSLSLSLGGGL